MFAFPPPSISHSSIDCGTTSCRFYIFDQWADVVASHQIEFEQSECPPPPFLSGFPFSLPTSRKTPTFWRHFLPFLLPKSLRSHKLTYGLSLQSSCDSPPRTRLARTRPFNLRRRNRQMYLFVPRPVLRRGTQEESVERSRDRDST